MLALNCLGGILLSIVHLAGLSRRWLIGLSLVAMVTACSQSGDLGDSHRINNRADIQPMSPAALAAAKNAPELHQVDALQGTFNSGKKIRSLLRQAVDANNPVAMKELGDRYWLGGNASNEDLATAVALYRRAAMQGYAAAEIALGKAYRLGKGIALDKTEAAYWYRQAWLQNDQTGTILYGIALLDGEGGAQDTQRGMALIEKASNESDFTAIKTMLLMRSVSDPQAGIELTPKNIDAIARTAAETM